MTDIPEDAGESWHLNKTNCPECGKMVDGASKAMGDEGGPEPGALAICAYCYAVNQYVAGEAEGELQLAAFDTSTLPLDERKELQRLRLWLANQDGPG